MPKADEEVEPPKELPEEDNVDEPVLLENEEPDELLPKPVPLVDELPKGRLVDAEPNAPPDRTICCSSPLPVPAGACNP